MRNQTLRVVGIRLFAIVILGLVTFKSVAQNLFSNNNNVPVNVFSASNNRVNSIELQTINYNDFTQTSLLANKFSSIHVSSPSYLDQNLVFSAPGNFNTVNISIANGGELGDSLFTATSFTGFETKYDAEKFTLTIYGQGDATAWQNLLREVQIITNSNTSTVYCLLNCRNVISIILFLVFFRGYTSNFCI